MNTQIQMQCPIQISDITNYRIYLRNSYYLNNMNNIIDILYSNIPSAIDISFDDNNEFIIKMRKRKNPIDIFTLYPIIENCIIQILNNVNSNIFKDTLLDPKTKMLYMNIYNNIINRSYIIKYLYNAFIINDYTLIFQL